MVMGQVNNPAGSLGPLPGNPTLFGSFGDASDLEFSNSAEEIASFYKAVMQGRYGLRLALVEEGISMYLLPLGVVLEEESAKITYMYGGPGALTGILVTLTAEGATGEVLSVGTGSVSWDSITGKPSFAAVATSGSYNDLTSKPTLVTTVTLTGAVTGTGTASGDTVTVDTTSAGA